jgi:DNA-binding response OmpR family regulator
MVFPPYAAPFPDSKDHDFTLGNQHRALLTALAQKPGRVLTSEELASRLPVPKLTPRRAEVLVGEINDVLGQDTVTEVPRRGWKLSSYEDAPSTISV